MPPRPRTDSPRRPPRAPRGETGAAIDRNPYLTFRDGLAREAMEFYASVLGGELTLNTFGDLGTEGPLAPQVMHGQLEAPRGLVLMGADAPPGIVLVTSGENVPVSLSGGPQDAERLRAWFAGLADGGEVRQPLEAAPSGNELGMLTDRYGIDWHVDIAGASAS